MQPTVVQYGLIASSTTVIVNNYSTATTILPLVSIPVTLDVQRRVNFTFAANESANTFRIVGLNQANMTISETITGSNATQRETLLDYYKIISITAASNIGGAVSVGTDSNGGSLWNIVNWHVTPVNIQYACILSGTLNATFTIQYTYDDPNNLPVGVTAPQAFNHPTITNQTATIDGSSNDPITAWRLLISGGTATIRAIGIQAGIGGP
jgi:hypothetical protein